MTKTFLGAGVALFAVTLMLSGCSQIDVENTTELQAPAQRSFVYEDTDQTFHVSGTIAQDWKEQKPANAQSPFIFTAPKTGEEGFNDNINIVRFEFDPGEKDMTLDDYVASVNVGMDTQDGFKLISQIKRDVAGYPAIVTTFQTTKYYNGALLQFAQTVFKTENEAYFITFSATPEGAATYENVYTEFLDSLLTK